MYPGAVPSPSLPVIDVSELRGGDPAPAARAIAEACQETGFFYAVNHGVDTDLIESLEALAREFFAWSLENKLAQRMELGGRAWRGYFPIGAELTSGQPDNKEGLYFGAELPTSDPRVRAGKPLHGPNQFPPLPGFRAAVLDTIAALTDLGHVLAGGISLSLDLPVDFLATRYTRDPLVLFRLFSYPPLLTGAEQWSVGEHTDYGLLTILHQDDAGGLQIKSHGEWIDAPPVPNSFVCNIGDMLDRLTGGRYRSTPHRVLNASDQTRLSMPFFFDPNMEASVEPIWPDEPPLEEDSERWDHASVHLFEGTYGDYLLAKVSRVFPALGEKAL